MERKTLLPVNSPIFEDMGIRIVKKDPASDEVKITYSYKKKVRGVNRPDKEHLVLNRASGDRENEVLYHYILEKYVIGWNDSRGKYHWPYDVYMFAVVVFALGVYAVARNLPDFATMGVFAATTSMGFMIGWILDWWRSLYQKVTIHETKMEGIKDAIVFDPDDMDMDSRYGTISADFTEMNTYSMPEDFFHEYVLVIGGIQILDKRKKMHVVVNNHIGNIARGPGVSGSKFANFVLIRGLPSVTIVPKTKEKAFASLNAYATAHKDMTKEQLAEATALVDDVYSSLSLSIEKQDELHQIVGDDFLKIDIQDDYLYAYFGMVESVSEETLQKYRDFLSKGGSMEPSVIASINKAKMYAEKELDFPMMLKKSEEKGFRKRIGQDRSVEISKSILDSKYAQERNYNAHVATGKEAAAKKDEIPLDDLMKDYLSEVDDEEGQ